MFFFLLRALIRHLLRLYHLCALFKARRSSLNSLSHLNKGSMWWAHCLRSGCWWASKNVSCKLFPSIAISTTETSLGCIPSLTTHTHTAHWIDLRSRVVSASFWFNFDRVCITWKWSTNLHTWLNFKARDRLGEWIWKLQPWTLATITCCAMLFVGFFFVTLHSNVSQWLRRWISSIFLGLGSAVGTSRRVSIARLIEQWPGKAIRIQCHGIWAKYRMLPIFFLWSASESFVGLWPALYSIDHSCLTFIIKMCIAAWTFRFRFGLPLATLAFGLSPIMECRAFFVFVSEMINMIIDIFEGDKRLATVGNENRRSGRIRSVICSPASLRCARYNQLIFHYDERNFNFRCSHNDKPDLFSAHVTLADDNPAWENIIQNDFPLIARVLICDFCVFHLQPGPARDDFPQRNGVATKDFVEIARRSQYGAGLHQADGGRRGRLVPKREALQSEYSWPFFIITH